MAAAWFRADGSLDRVAFMQHAMSLLGDPEDRWSLDLDAVARSIVTRPSWHLDAACRGQGTAAFYSPGGTVATRHALAVCAGCAVSEQCRQAGADGDEAGVWGGVRLAPRTPGVHARQPIERTTMGRARGAA